MSHHNIGVIAAMWALGAFVFVKVAKFLYKVIYKGLINLVLWKENRRRTKLGYDKLDNKEE